MAKPGPEWLDKLESYIDRTNARQRAQVDTGKLIATFSAGIIATIVATALQVGTPSTWDRIAAFLLAISFLSALVAILFDRLTEADQAAIVQQAKASGWSDAKVLRKLRSAMLAATIVNEGVVRAVRLAVTVQLTVSLLAGAAAIISLLANG